jgi:hypothetical protein
MSTNARPVRVVSRRNRWRCALAAARDDDDTALTNETIWALMEAEPEDVRCIQGLDIVTIAQALCEEARLRGLSGRWMSNTQVMKTYGRRYRSHL